MTKESSSANTNATATLARKPVHRNLNLRISSDTEGIMENDLLRFSGVVYSGRKEAARTGTCEINSADRVCVSSFFDFGKKAETGWKRWRAEATTRSFPSFLTKFFETKFSDAPLSVKT